MSFSKYFTLEELSASATARAAGIDNTPPPVAVCNLQKLCIRTLDPLRKAIGMPLNVTSGYRSEALNKAVRGVPNSQHIEGKAADITAGSSVLNRVIFEKIRDGGIKIPFDQLICEPKAAWLHISYNGAACRRQVIDNE